MKKVLLITFGIIIVVALAVLYSFVDKQTSYYDTAAAPADTVGEITSDKEIQLSFVAEENNMKSISLKFGTYGRTNTGSLKVTLLDASEAVVFEKNIDVQDIKDNAFRTFTFTPYVNSSNQTFTLRISSSDGTPKNAVMIYTYGPQGDSTQLLVNGEKQEQSLAFAATYHNFDVETLIVMLFFIAVIIAFIFFIFNFL